MKKKDKVLYFQKKRNFPCIKYPNRKYIYRKYKIWFNMYKYNNKRLSNK